VVENFSLVILLLKYLVDWFEATTTYCFGVWSNTGEYLWKYAIWNAFKIKTYTV